MSKRLYPHNRVRYWYAYDLDEICTLFADTGLHIQTVRKWIVKDGLRTIDTGKPALVYGHNLIEFIKHQNDKGKCKTAFDQIYCMKCKDARPTLKNKVTTEKKGNLLKVSGQCRCCKTVMFKTYKMDDLMQIHRIFHVVGVLELYDCAIPSAKTQIPTHLPERTNESFMEDLFA